MTVLKMSWNIINSRSWSSEPLNSFFTKKSSLWGLSETIFKELFTIAINISALLNISFYLFLRLFLFIFFSCVFLSSTRWCLYKLFTTFFFRNIIFWFLCAPKLADDSLTVKTTCVHCHSKLDCTVFIKFHLVFFLANPVS